MFEVDVKNVMEGRRRAEGGDQLGFGVLMCEVYTAMGNIADI